MNQDRWALVLWEDNGEVSVIPLEDIIKVKPKDKIRAGWTGVLPWCDASGKATPYTARILQISKRKKLLENKIISPTGKVIKKAVPPELAAEKAAASKMVKGKRASKKLTSKKSSQRVQDLPSLFEDDEETSPERADNLDVIRNENHVSTPPSPSLSTSFAQQESCENCQACVCKLLRSKVTVELCEMLLQHAQLLQNLIHGGGVINRNTLEADNQIKGPLSKQDLNWLYAKSNESVSNFVRLLLLEFVGEKKLVEYGNVEQLEKNYPHLQQLITGYVMQYSEKNLTSLQYKNIVRKKIWRLKNPTDVAKDDSVTTVQSTEKSASGQAKKRKDVTDPNKETAPMKKIKNQSPKTIDPESSHQTQSIGSKDDELYQHSPTPMVETPPIRSPKTIDSKSSHQTQSISSNDDDLHQHSPTPVVETPPIRSPKSIDSKSSHQTQSIDSQDDDLHQHSPTPVVETPVVETPPTSPETIDSKSPPQTQSIGSKGDDIHQQSPPPVKTPPSVKQLRPPIRPTTSDVSNPVTPLSSKETTIQKTSSSKPEEIANSGLKSTPVEPELQNQAQSNCGQSSAIQSQDQSGVYLSSSSSNQYPSNQYPPNQYPPNQYPSNQYQAHPHYGQTFPTYPNNAQHPPYQTSPYGYQWPAPGPAHYNQYHYNQFSQFGGPGHNGMYGNQWAQDSWMPPQNADQQLM